jgi:magnesium-transporting ATPase (P-type)
MKQHLTNFASKGLRTLVFGYRLISREEYEQWSVEYNKLKFDMELSNEEKQIEMEKCAEKMEKDLTILSSTGLEDQLADQVPECLHDFRKAGIKVWMITGDK